MTTAPRAVRFSASKLCSSRSDQPFFCPFLAQGLGDNLSRFDLTHNSGFLFFYACLYCSVRDVPKKLPSAETFASVRGSHGALTRSCSARQGRGSRRAPEAGACAAGLKALSNPPEPSSHPCVLGQNPRTVVIHQVMSKPVSGPKSVSGLGRTLANGSKKAGKFCPWFLTQVWW